MKKTYQKALLEFAEQLGLTLDTQAVTLFGVHNGYSVLLAPVNETYQFTLSVSVCRQDEAPDAKVVKGAVATSKAISSCMVQGYRVTYTLKAGMTANKTGEKLQEALGAITEYLRTNGFENCCQTCGATGATDSYNISGTGALLCGHCFADQSEAAIAKQALQSQKSENLVGGIVGALLGSLLGAAVIVLLGQLGYVAALSGIVLGVCTLRGYELLGGRLSKKGITVSIVMMLVMVYVGNRADWAISVAGYLETDVFSAFRLIPFLLQGGYLEAANYYGNLAMVYLFTAVGAGPTITNALRTKKQANVSHKMSGDSLQTFDTVDM